MLGAAVQRDGRMSSMLADRVQQALALWRAARSTGSSSPATHHRWSYDEPGTMSDTVLGEHVLLGPPVPISGDGRASWGPAGPAASSR